MKAGSQAYLAVCDMKMVITPYMVIMDTGGRIQWTVIQLMLTVLMSEALIRTPEWVVTRNQLDVQSAV